jgi:hypothetical protein
LSPAALDGAPISAKPAGVPPPSRPPRSRRLRLPADVPRASEATVALRRITGVNLTFYDCAAQGFCGAMANGTRVYEGAAACSYDLPLGTRFHIIGDDRPHLPLR